MIEFSWFRGFFSNEPQRCSCASWEEFVRIMYQISEVEGYKPSADEYDKEMGLISSAIYAEDGMKRCNENVSGWDILMLDIDDDLNDIEYLRTKLKPFNYLIYSSASCTKEHLKMRVIIPLSERAPKDKLDEVWYAANQWCDDIIDTQTKDMSRMMYQPARYVNKGKDYFHIFDVHSGICLDWKQMIAKWPMPPKSERYKVSNPLRNLKRAVFMETNEIPSMDILDPNCPFVNKYMIDEYRLTPAGGHHKAIYIFMLKVCGNADRIGYPLSIDELVDMARQLDDIDGGWYDDKKLYNSAKDALEYSGV